MDQLEEAYQNTQEDSEDTEIMDINAAPDSIKRRLFLTTVTKEKYLAIALHQLQRTSPNASPDEIANFIIQYEDEYRLQGISSPTFPSPSPPVTVPSFSPGLPPAFNIVFSNTLTDKEKEVPQLNADANVRQFLSWQRHAKDTLSLIENFNVDILTYPRASITFESHLTRGLIDQLYRVVWTKVRTAVRTICDINVGLAGVSSPHVDQLWVRLQKTFLPTTTAEKYGLEHEFGNL